MYLSDRARRAVLWAACWKKGRRCLFNILTFKLCAQSTISEKPVSHTHFCQATVSNIVESPAMSRKEGSGFCCTKEHLPIRSGSRGGAKSASLAMRGGLGKHSEDLKEFFPYHLKLVFHCFILISCKKNNFLPTKA